MKNIELNRWQHTIVAMLANRVFKHLDIIEDILFSQLSIGVYPALNLLPLEQLGKLSATALSTITGLADTEYLTGHANRNMPFHYRSFGHLLTTRWPYHFFPASPEQSRPPWGCWWSEIYCSVIVSCKFSFLSIMEILLLNATIFGGLSFYSVRLFYICFTYI